MCEELNVSMKFYYLLYESICDGLKDVAKQLKNDEAAKVSDELIVYMELGYPVKFGYCRPCDFREVYLAHQTDIEVELPGKGYDSVIYEYARLNTCVPILRTNYCDLIADESDRVDCEFLDNISHEIIGHRDDWLGQWHDDYKMDGAGKFWIAKQIINIFAADYFFDYLFYCLLNYHKNSLATKVEEQTWYE